MIMKQTLLRLYLQLLQGRSWNQQRRGFVLPLVIGLGLIMTVAGLTMVIRSSDNNISSISQQQTAQALAVAETGVTRTTGFINLIRPLADQDIDNWQQTFDEVVAACKQDGDEEALLNDYVNGNWMELINNNQHRFRVLDYQYTAFNPDNINSSGVGVLRVEGQANFSLDRKWELWLNYQPTCHCSKC